MLKNDTRTDGAALARRVISHFPTVTLSVDGAFGPHGTTWDDYADFAEHMRGETWSSLEFEFVRRHREALYFVVDEALPALLPSWLMPVLVDEDDGGELERTLIVALSPDELNPLPSWSVRFSGLSLPQTSVVADVVEWLEKRYRESRRRSDWRWVDEHDNPLTPALNLYWRRFVTRQRQYLSGITRSV